MKQTKEAVRDRISEIKKSLSEDELLSRSEEVIMVLEATDTFNKSSDILIYNSLKDEVRLKSLFDKYNKEKRFYLPVINGTNELSVRKFDVHTQFERSMLGILEPIGEDIDIKNIDLIVVPGIAFDYSLNRLGRGKGYYDKFLKRTKVPKIGICFDFQLLDNIPTDDLDVAMDMVVAENEIICNGIY